MKKVSLLVVMALMTGLCLTGCKNKSQSVNTQEEGQDSSIAEQTDSEMSDADMGVSSDNALLDNYNVCPICFQVEGKTDADGNAVTVERRWIMGSSLGTGILADWVLYNLDARYNFNPDGWHFVGKDIVNADESYKINDEDVWMSLSSYCTIRTEKYKKPESVEPYEHVTMHRIYMADDADGEAPLLKTQGNQHASVSAEVKEYFESKELTDCVQTSFYLQEWVNVQLPAEYAGGDVILAVKSHEPKYDGMTFDEDKLSTCLWSGTPDLNEETGYAQVDFYVAETEPVGFYDLLFIKGGKVMGWLTLVMAKK